MIKMGMMYMQKHIQFLFNGQLAATSVDLCHNHITNRHYKYKVTKWMATLPPLREGKALKLLTEDTPYFFHYKG